jgi:hypothetical protein
MAETFGWDRKNSLKDWLTEAHKYAYVSFAPKTEKVSCEHTLELLSRFSDYRVQKVSTLEFTHFGIKNIPMCKLASQCHPFFERILAQRWSLISKRHFKTVNEEITDLSLIRYPKVFTGVGYVDPCILEWANDIEDSLFYGNWTAQEKQLIQEHFQDLFSSKAQMLAHAIRVFEYRYSLV